MPSGALENGAYAPFSTIPWCSRKMVHFLCTIFNENFHEN
jgi:hypothetical protein